MVSKVGTKKTFVEDITVAQAMDNLTSMGGLDKGFLKKGKKISKEVSRWWDAEDDLLTLENIKMTFKVLLHYLKETHKKDKEKIQDEETQKGIQALMTLVGEAVHRIDHYTYLIDKGVLNTGVAELKEYQELQEFYQKKVLKKFQKGSDVKDLWKEEWGDPHGEAVEERGLKDLEAVKQDLNYELLYIKKEDGSRFFNRNLLRHIKLVNDFDQMVVSEAHDDPFLLLQKLQDKNALEAAREMEGKLKRHLGAFLKLHPHQQASECAEKLLSGVYALYLAASQHSSLETGSKKSCSQYLRDFALFLNETFLSTDYQAHRDKSEEEMNAFIEGMLLFSYHLCEQFFLCIGAKDQMIGLINRLMDKLGAGEKEKPRSSTQMWTSLAAEYEHLDHVLQKYPNGPLFKTLDVFSSSETGDVFEPLMQENYPSLLYSIQNEAFKIAVLRLPSPTKQEMINKAEISVIFESFVRSLKLLHPHQKLLIVNLQDRTSWQEHARCHVLEQMPKLSSFVDSLDVCTFAKSTSFYKQSEDYLEVNAAEDFKKLFLQQIVDAQECGFYFPKSLVTNHLQDFTSKAIELIHEHFFGYKSTLSHKNRLDFIEIFYFFLNLKVLDVLKPSHFTLSCKDAIDTAPASYAGFFAFLKLMSSDDEWSKEEEDFFVWMIQSPALLYRERAIHADRYQRAISALSVVSAELQVDKRKTLEAFEKLYGYPIFKTLNVREAKA